MSDNSFVVIILIIKTFRHFFEYILEKIYETNNLNPDIYGNTSVYTLISNYYITIKTDVDHKIKMLRRDYHVSFRIERIILFYNKTRTKEQQVGIGGESNNFVARRDESRSNGIVSQTNGSEYKFPEVAKLWSLFGVYT